MRFGIPMSLVFYSFLPQLQNFCLWKKIPIPSTFCFFFTGPSKKEVRFVNYFQYMFTLCRYNYLEWICKYESYYPLVVYRTCNFCLLKHQKIYLTWLCMSSQYQKLRFSRFGLPSTLKVQQSTCTIFKIDEWEIMKVRISRSKIAKGIYLDAGEADSNQCFSCFF